jgi:hypothetical protein
VYSKLVDFDAVWRWWARKISNASRHTGPARCGCDSLMLHLYAVLAEKERRLIAERTRGPWQRKGLEGPFWAIDAIHQTPLVSEGKLRSEELCQEPSSAERHLGCSIALCCSRIESSRVGSCCELLVM